MRIEKSPTTTKYILDPGDYYVTNKNVVITTLLGSCIAACLYDPINRVMAMNHFLLSYRRSSTENRMLTSDAGRYGIHAMELIINGMLKLGAQKKFFKAKVFGGGNVLHLTSNSGNNFNIGELNISFIREFLESEKIPLSSSDLGGHQGRVIYFDGADYSVYVRKIQSSESIKIIERDKSYLDATVRRQINRTEEVELWNKDSLKNKN